MKQAFYFFIATIMVLVIGCGSDKPKDLRTEFRKKIESGLGLTLPMMAPEGTKISKELIACTAQHMTDTFSDDEIKLIIDSSFSERLKNPAKIMEIQQKMESPEYTHKYMQTCATEIYQAR
ncbi:hypothetical protein CQA53_04165 [Helicobacter didelphidarum]|uniref:Lipoprotein n=1 Tax=Helicobacter didelphidarum TaxID=2040648 RepID=A0A3D8IM07_9HELI|nr:hypothetical protein [Helicobacter didelphidarum]RDU66212.1 hypothetical protein CQA53_04165 [Helicobacter didelphidarum]